MTPQKYIQPPSMDKKEDVIHQQGDTYMEDILTSSTYIYF